MLVNQVDAADLPRGDEDGSRSTFPERLAQVIGSSSVRGFARRAEVSDTFLRQCLSGRTEPTRTKLIAIARAGEVSVEWLATGTTSVTTADPEATTIDRPRLEASIAAAESALASSNRSLSAPAKARLVVRIYGMHGPHGSSPPSPAQVLELLACAE